MKTLVEIHLKNEKKMNMDFALNQRRYWAYVWHSNRFCLLRSPNEGIIRGCARNSSRWFFVDNGTKEWQYAWQRKCKSFREVGQYCSRKQGIKHHKASSAAERLEINNLLVLFGTSDCTGILGHKQPLFSVDITYIHAGQHEVTFDDDDVQLLNIAQET